jgi:hypothetical protein
VASLVDAYAVSTAVFVCGQRKARIPADACCVDLDIRT